MGGLLGCLLCCWVLLVLEFQGVVDCEGVWCVVVGVQYVKCGDVVVVGFVGFVCQVVVLQEEVQFGVFFLDQVGIDQGVGVLGQGFGEVGCWVDFVVVVQVQL